MIKLAALPVVIEILVAMLVLIGAALALTGSIGLIRLKSFYDRVHAPTLGATLGLSCILLASMLYFWTAGTRPVVHEILIALFLTVTTPVTMLLLVHATIYRDRLESRDPLATPAATSTGETGSTRSDRT